MKKFIALTAMVLVSSAVQAKTLCTINVETVKGSQIYDRNIYSAEITQPNSILISKDRTSAKVLDLSTPLDLQELKSAHGQKIVAFAFSPGSSVMYITLGKVDALNEKSIFKLIATTASTPSVKEPTFMVSNDFALACVAF